jgi:hypothetical protein
MIRRIDARISSIDGSFAASAFAFGSLMRPLPPGAPAGYSPCGFAGVAPPIDVPHQRPRVSA